MDIIATCTEDLLEAIGEDVTREGLIGTPERVSRMWYEITSGLREQPPKITTFSAEGQDQMVTVLDVDYWSLCEHHLVPFYGRVHIGYLPGKRLAGLSKFARVVDHFARRPQIQEAMTAQIADFLIANLEPAGLIVVVEGTHLCMSMRGVRKPNHVTVTSAIRGEICRDEFFNILHIERG